MGYEMGEVRAVRRGNGDMDEQRYGLRRGGGGGAADGMMERVD